MYILKKPHDMAKFVVTDIDAERMVFKCCECGVSIEMVREDDMLPHEHNCEVPDTSSWDDT